jgi:predicted 3-demethylubiquinone-9 3-methyltransferase (glyoxalase superfamily)
MQKITPFLWFKDQAEEAAEFYVSVFPGSKVTGTNRYAESGLGTPGTVMTVSFELAGQPFTALNGGQVFDFTSAISFVIHCSTAEEVDHYWSKLSEGGQEQMCGWLVDRFGVTWQVVPTALMDMLSDPDPTKVQRVTEVMLKMKKLDLAELQQAYGE